jgi:hypothetical protein
MTATVHIDTSSLDRLARRLNATAAQTKTALRRAISHEGRKARTAVVAATTEQTGMKTGTIRRAVKGASVGGLAYAIRSKGGNVRLKYFKRGPRETRKGVTAYPRGEMTAYPGAFIKGGRFPNRVSIGLGGHVYRRKAGARRGPIEAVKSGVYIPDEMICGKSLQGFMQTARVDVPKRVIHEVQRIIGGKV